LRGSFLIHLTPLTPSLSTGGKADRHPMAFVEARNVETFLTLRLSGRRDYLRRGGRDPSPTRIWKAINLL
jgi:hypothetical protein